MSDQVAVLETEVESYQVDAKSLIVRSKPDYDKAAQATILNKKLQKKIVDFFEPMKTKSRASWKEICKRENDLLDPLKAEEAGRKKRMRLWWDGEETKRIEKERKEQAKIQKQLEEQRDAKVEKLADFGDLKAAADLQDAEIVAPEVHLEDRGKVEGISKRDHWTFVILDETQIPRVYLKVDEQKIRKYVATMKADAKIPGVKVYNDPILAAKI